MIKEYYDWLTYNPANIPITSLIRPIAFALIIIAIIMCAFYYAFSEKVSFKTIIVCFLLSPYVLLSILWEICFLNENLFVYLVPLYAVESGRERTTLTDSRIKLVLSDRLFKSHFVRWG